MADNRKTIAKNIAELLRDGNFVNLGVGIPTLVSNYIPEDICVLLHGENGCIGQDKELPLAHTFASKTEAVEWMREHGDENGDWKKGHRDLNNAGCSYITLIPGGCCFDSAMSFTIARGGHLDATVLGGLQVDAERNLANWMVPGKSVKGMGGAMDLVSGANKVIIAMEHCSKNGEPKLVKKCTMPLTAIKCVNTIVTELCVIEFENGLAVVKAMMPGITRKGLIAKTDMPLQFGENIKEMLIA